LKVLEITRSRDITVINEKQSKYKEVIKLLEIKESSEVRYVIVNYEMAKKQNKNFFFNKKNIIIDDFLNIKYSEAKNNKLFPIANRFLFGKIKPRKVLNEKLDIDSSMTEEDSTNLSNLFF